MFYLKKIYTYTYIYIFIFTIFMLQSHVKQIFKILLTLLLTGRFDNLWHTVKL